MSQLENPVRFGMVSHAKNPVLNSRVTPSLHYPIPSTTSFSCTGPAGEAGPQGPMGERGPTGFLGMRGEVGPQGPEGTCSCSPKEILSDIPNQEKKISLIESDETVSVEGQTTLLSFELTKGSHIVYCIATYYSNSQGDVHLEFNILDEDDNKVNKTSYYNTSKKSSGYTTISFPVLINVEKDNQSFNFTAKGKDGYPIKVSLSQIIF